MGRAIRFIFIATSALCLLLCAASVGIWVRSFAAGDDWVWMTSETANLAGAHCEATMGKGRFVAIRMTAYFNQADSFHYYPQPPETVSGPGGAGWWARMGFGLELASRDGSGPVYVFDDNANPVPTTERIAFAAPRKARAPFSFYLAFPLWFPPVLFGLLALPAIVKLRRRISRRPPGMCARCGYDLRATPGRCPECGTVPKKRPAW